MQGVGIFLIWSSNKLSLVSLLLIWINFNPSMDK